MSHRHAPGLHVHDAGQQFLRVNRWDGVLWFNKESFDQLLAVIFASALVEIGAPVDDPIREMREMYAKVKDRGPGPHFVTGPVAVEGAMPGDVLEVEILDIRLRSPYGWMMIEPGAGAREIGTLVLRT